MRKPLKRFITISIIFAIIITLIYTTQIYQAENKEEISAVIYVIFWISSTTVFFMCYNAFANYNEKRYKQAEENRKIRQAQIKLAEEILKKDIDK